MKNRDQVTLTPNSSKAAAAKPKPRGFFDAAPSLAGKTEIPARPKRENLTDTAEHTAARADSIVQPFTRAVAARLRREQASKSTAIDATKGKNKKEKPHE